MIATCICSPPIAPATSDAHAPQQVIQELTDNLLVVLRDQDLGSDERRQRIEEIAYTNIDFETVSRLVLARNWRQFSDPQRQEFIDEFKRHLSATYGRNLDRYRNEEVEIVGDRQEARGDVTVATKVLREGPTVLVDYRLRQRDGNWRIIDVVIEGVSLVSNFRSQFQDIVSNEGPDQLLQLLREKNANPELFESRQRPPDRLPSTHPFRGNVQ